MVNETDEVRTDAEEEQEGGPVKSFLDHLEDLRWTLIKSGSALAIAMLLCLIAGDKVVTLIERPLKHTTVRYPDDVQVVSWFFGTNRLGVFQLNRQQQAAFPVSTNRFLALQIAPVLVGSNQYMLGLNIDTNATPQTGTSLSIKLSTFSPVGGFFVAFQVALYGGLVLAAPFIFYFVAQFVFPALKLNEKKYVYRGLGFGGVLFFMGVAFCYFVLMPLALSASVQYSNWMGFSADQWRAEDYISFVCKFMLGMGLGFELPVVILTLVKIGVLNYAILSKARRYMIVINLILGALLTTPEVVTQVAMAIPLQILYEASVWITWYWERRDRKRAAAMSQVLEVSP